MRATAGLVLVITVASGICNPADAEDRRPIVTAAAHNYANVPGDVLTEAQTQVARVFRQAGVDVTWVDSRVDRVAVRVHLLPAPMTMRTRTPADVLGLTTVRSRMVYVLYDRVVEKSEMLNVRTSKVLAYVMAHEIGHVLLEGRPHGHVGLMRRTLYPDVLRRGLIGFTREESRQMRGSEVLSK